MPQAAQSGKKTRKLIGHSNPGAESSLQNDLVDFARVAAALCDAPMSAISRCDSRQVHLAAAFGFRHPPHHQSISFYTPNGSSNGVAFILSKVDQDPNFQNHPLLGTDVPIKDVIVLPFGNNEANSPCGVLEIMSPAAMTLSPTQQQALQSLTRQIEQRFRQAERITDSSGERGIPDIKEESVLLEMAKLTLDPASDAILWLDVNNGSILYANESACSRYQYSRAELTDMNIADLNPAVRDPATMDLVRDQIVHRRKHQFEAIHIAKDGTKIPVESTSCLVDLNGMSFFCVFIRNIRERLDQQQKLDRIHADYELIFEALPFGAITTDTQRTITRVNPAFATMFGYTSDELIGQNTRMLYANQSDFESYGNSRFSKSASFRLDPFEIEFRRKNGENFICQCVGTQVVKGGKNVGYVALVQDVSERVNARHELERLSEDRRAMLELLGSTDGVWSWQIGTDDCHYAPAFRRILGFDSESGQTFPNSWSAFLERIHPEERGEFERRTNQCLDSGKAFQFEFRLRNANDEYFWARASANATRFPGGIAKRFIGTMHDVTEIKKAEHEREAFFNAGIQHYGVADMKDATWVRASDNWQEVLGFTSEELTGNNYLEMAHPDDRPQYIENMKTLAEGKPLVGFRGRMRHKNGSYRWIEFNVAPPENETLHVYFTARDITYEDQDLLHRIADAVPLTLFVLDLSEMALTFVSRHVGSLLGYTVAEFMSLNGTVTGSLTHPGDRRRQIVFLEQIANGSDEELHDVQLRVRAKTGEYRELYLTARVNNRTPDGKVKEIVGTATLVDQLTLLRKYAYDLENANEDLEQFAYIASHDLKQPLRGIDNLAKWIEEDSGDALPDVAQEHLGRLKGRVRRMERLLDDLLDYSRIGRTSTKTEEVESGNLLEEIIDIVAPPPAFEISWKGPAISFITERVPLEQVLRNLVGNAVKHREQDEGKVQISARSVDKMLEFSVRDNGPGIAPEFHERIFRMFQTLRPRDELEASGMGLALAKKHVELRGGKITVESQVGSGTTFRFTWPGTIENGDATGAKRIPLENVE